MRDVWRMCASTVVDRGASKITSVKYNDIVVDAHDLLGTYMHMTQHCSHDVLERLARWMTGGVRSSLPDLGKAAQFEGLLYISKYLPQDEWEMDEDQQLWDKAVLELMEEVTRGGEYRTHQWMRQQGLVDGVCPTPPGL